MVDKCCFLVGGAGGIRTHGRLPYTWFRVIASIRNIAENGGKQGPSREDKNSVFDWENEGLIEIFQEITEKFE